MGTAEKLKHLKEVLAIVFTNATEQSIEFGLQYKYSSYSFGEGLERGWAVDIHVKEAAYPDRIIQTIKFQYPSNIDPKNMEYNVLLHLLATITMSSLITWYETAKMLATDKDLQKVIIDETKKSNFSSN